MLAGVIVLRHDLQIQRIVVVLVTVDVMHNLAGRQRPAENLFSNNSMLMPAMALSISRFFNDIKPS
jgi:hypothetical protein